MLPFLILDFCQILIFSMVLFRFQQLTGSNRYLIIIFLGGAMAVLSKITLYLAAPQPNFLTSISSTVCFSAMSHLFLYENVSGRKVKLWITVLHLLPMTLSILIFINALGALYHPTDEMWWLIISKTFRPYVLLFYFILDVWCLWKYRNTLSNLKDQINGGLLAYFVIHKVLLIGLLIFPKHLLPHESLNLYLGLLSMPTILAVIVYFKVILVSNRKNQELEDSIAVLLEKETALNDHNSTVTYNSCKYQKSNLDDDKYQVLATRIKIYVQQEKPYLDMDFTAAQLAESLEVSQHDLSIAINQYLDSTFYEYINGLRIQYFLSQIDRVIAGEMTILVLAYTSGFSSKSTFNKYFKLLVGSSPSAYIDQHVKEQQANSLLLD